MDGGELLNPTLNISQVEAVNSLEGPLLILAGAGSGKTRVLTYRAARLVYDGLASPGQMLIVTFTNKAAKEMAHRIYQLLGKLQISIVDRLWISTFHSACTRILRDHIEELGYKSTFGIYDSSDQLAMVKKVLQSLGLNDKIYPPKTIQARINNAKTAGLNPEQVSQQPRFIMDGRTLEIYRLYEKEMKKANCLDFGDLLLKTHELFVSHPSIIAAYQEKFKFIMVDEYQDTNRIQYLLVKMLAGGHRNLCVVGDEDQSIYSWRGADIGNILSFEKDFPECKTIKLEQNYRSTRNIVLAATKVIKNNSERKDKTLFTENPDGELILVREEPNEYGEARFVIKEVEKLVAANYKYSDVAVFYRTNAQSRVFEEQLRSHSIPYKLVGGTKFYERMEIKDIIGYMRLALNPADDMALKRVINRPTRGIGKTTLQKVEDLAVEQNSIFFEALKVAVEQGLLNRGTSKKINDFVLLVNNLQSEANRGGPREVYHKVLEVSGYADRLKLEDTVEAAGRLENLEELDNALDQFEKERGDEATLQSFLEEIALISDGDAVDVTDCVTLMTLHISKGLEYPVVFIVGMEEGLFPSALALRDSEDGEAEEERRLAYVGMTRARERLFLTHAKTRRVWGQPQHNPPSRFLQELPEELIQRESIEENFESFDEFPDYEGADQDSNQDNDMNDMTFKRGMKVRHPSFGFGKIYEIQGQGDWQKVSVLFSDQSIRKFVTKYARLERA